MKTDIQYIEMSMIPRLLTDTYNNFHANSLPAGQAGIRQLKNKLFADENK